MKRDAKAILSRSMPEKALQAHIIKAARLHGWLVYHALPAMNRRGKWGTHTQGNVGFPDLVLCNGKTGQLIFAELKREGGRISVDQLNWIYNLGSVVHRPIVKVVKPRDLDEFYELLAEGG